MELAYDQNIVYKTDGVSLHICEMSNLLKQDVIDEYGRLFAAAPELLKRLIELNEALDDYWNSGNKPDILVRHICMRQKLCLQTIDKATKGNLITPIN
jgi:hypothetical protein